MRSKFIHEPRDPHARVGDVAGCLSGADGRRLRTCRRALSVFSRAASDRRGAHISRLDLSLSGQTDGSHRRMQAGHRARPRFRQSLQRHWRLPDRTRPVRRSHSLAAAGRRIPSLRTAAFSALQSRPSVPRKGNVWPGDPLFPGSDPYRTALFARSASAGVASPHGQLISSISSSSPASSSNKSESFVGEGLAPPSSVVLVSVPSVNPLRPLCELRSFRPSSRLPYSTVVSDGFTTRS